MKKRTYLKCKNCNKIFYSGHRNSKFCCRTCYYKWKKGQPSFFKGKKRPEVSRGLMGKKLSLSHRLNLSKVHKKSDSNYKLIKRLRQNITYKEWRTKVFIRDNFTCCSCHIVGGKLQAHHIISFSNLMREYKIKTLEQALKCKELWNISNGITLCIDCHRLTDNYGGKGIKIGPYEY